MADAYDGQPPAKTKSALILTVVAVLAVTCVGGAGGWFVGKLLAPAVETSKLEEIEQKAAPAAVEGEEEGLPRLATEENGIYQLEPIATNLAFPADRWVRLEVALLFNQKPDAKLAEAIHQDIALYLRTVSLQQIEGPRGFQYLKEDLEERADMISEGKVKRLMFRTFHIQ